MLAPTRNPGESIVVKTSDGDITIFVEQGNWNQIKVKLDAPKPVKIWRSELLDDNAA
jgi:sRNA-binding carbon storage regulator CsrA